MARGYCPQSSSEGAAWPYTGPGETPMAPPGEPVQIRELRPDGLWLCRPAPPRAKGRVQETWEAMGDCAGKAWGAHVQGLVTI